jgi:hypothetical protein
MRINVNGPAYTGLDFPGHWAADPGAGGVCQPNPYQNDVPIHGTRDGALFAREMFGAPLICALGSGDLPPGLYHVNLYFAEIYWGPGCPGGGPGPGSRLFDIRLEGSLVLSNLDIFAEGGCGQSRRHRPPHRQALHGRGHRRHAGPAFRRAPGQRQDLGHRSNLRVLKGPGSMMPTR